MAADGYQLRSSPARHPRHLSPADGPGGQGEDRPRRQVRGRLEQGHPLRRAGGMSRCLREERWRSQRSCLDAAMRRERIPGKLVGGSEGQGGGCGTEVPAK